MKVDSSLLFQKTGIFQSFELGALWAFVLSSDFSLRYFRHMASVICFFVICYDSNANYAMTFSNYFSNFSIVCVVFLCLDFGVQLVQETPRSLSQRWLSIQSTSHHFNVTGTSLLRGYLVNDCQPRLPWHFCKGAPVQVAAGCRCSKFIRAAWDLIWLNVAICLRLRCRATNLP